MVAIWEKRREKKEKKWKCARRVDKKKTVLSGGYGSRAIRERTYREEESK